MEATFTAAAAAEPKVRVGKMKTFGLSAVVVVIISYFARIRTTTTTSSALVRNIYSSMNNNAKSTDRAIRSYRYMEIRKMVTQSLLIPSFHAKRSNESTSFDFPPSRFKVPPHSRLIVKSKRNIGGIEI